MGSIYKKYSQVFHEFLRYLLVGGGAFIVDFLVLFLSRTYIFFDKGQTGILISTALGFTAGLIVNFILSFNFVFRENTENAKQNRTRSFILFAIIGIVGLLITQVFMFTGINLIGEKWYLLIKCFTTGVVLMWNYIARKILIFRGAGYAKV